MCYYMVTNSEQKYIGERISCILKAFCDLGDEIGNYQLKAVHRIPIDWFEDLGDADGFPDISRHCYMLSIAFVLFSVYCKDHYIPNKSTALFWNQSASIISGEMIWHEVQSIVTCMVLCTLRVWIYTISNLSYELYFLTGFLMNTVREKTTRNCHGHLHLYDH